MPVTRPAPAPVPATPAPALRRFFAAPRRVLGRSLTWRQVVFGGLTLFCLTPWASPPLALALGLALALTLGNPFAARSKALTRWLLQGSVVGLGFGLKAPAALQAGREGLLLTVALLAATLALAYVLGRGLGVGRRVAHLIACGTAICGGSAIAAVGPALRAPDEEMSVALGTVFVLNAIALFVFPPIGHALGLTPHQFGLWCALAIHDTSSVVGAAATFGPAALAVATTVKLARALWIMPVALGSALAFRQPGARVAVPGFILGFVAALLLATYVPAVATLAPALTHLAKLGLTLTLFLIGAGLSAGVLRAVGVRPLLLGGVLWLAVSVAALLVVGHLA